MLGECLKRLSVIGCTTSASNEVRQRRKWSRVKKRRKVVRENFGETKVPNVVMEVVLVAPANSKTSS